MLNPRALVYAAVVTDGGHTFGDVVTPEQRRMIDAFFDQHGPRLMFWLMARGWGKTMIAALLMLAWLVCEAPPLATAAILAGSGEQAALAIESIAAIVYQTQEFRSVVKVSGFKAENRQNGAVVEVLASDSTNVLGRRDHITLCDEICNWKETPGVRRVYENVRSGIHKQNGRLILASTPGEYQHWTYPMLEAARTDLAWSVLEIEGSAPWQSQDAIDALVRELRPDVAERLVYGRWAAPQDTLATIEDVEAACVL